VGAQTNLDLLEDDAHDVEEPEGEVHDEHEDDEECAEVEETRQG